MTEYSCDRCINNEYDEETDEYFCDVDMDEDEFMDLQMHNYKSCPYYRPGDEYTIVRKQN